jgi:hypothetical protein
LAQQLIFKKPVNKLKSFFKSMAIKLDIWSFQLNCHP